MNNTVMNKSIEMMGVPICPITMDQTIEWISNRIDNGLFTQHVVINVAKLVQMRKQPQLREAIMSCDIVNIDGMGIVWGGRFLGHKIPERVAGIDLFFNLLELASLKNYPVFLLGAKEEVLKMTIMNLKRAYPKLTIAGSHHGYFWDDEATVVEKIRKSGASMLFVAVSSPKKEEFIDFWKEKLSVKYAMGVGGTFDVVAGVTRRAPLWMQKSGLEWFYRVIQEPRRMWKRYFITNTIYLCLLLREKCKTQLSKLLNS